MTERVPHADEVPLRIGAVSFLNTAPLIDGLDRLEACRVRPSVPSLLIDQLLADEVDVALCSTIDYLRAPVPLRLLPAGQLGGAGATLTVRLYARRPIEALTEVHVDTDSHTSVALLRIILAERYGIRPAIRPYHARERVAAHRPLEWPDAMLLIGDKVVTDSPPAVRYPHQIDLGAAWFTLTGLPFVFAMWMVRTDLDPHRLARAGVLLDRQRRANTMRLGALLSRRLQGSRWPADLAVTYITECLQYEVTPRSLEGLRAFFDRAVSHGIVDADRPLDLVSPYGKASQHAPASLST